MVLHTNSVRDVFRHANESENQNLTLHFDANYLMGEHDLKFGVQVERMRVVQPVCPKLPGFLGIR